MVKQSTNEMNVFFWRHHRLITKWRKQKPTRLLLRFFEEFGAGRDDGEEWWVWYKVTHRNLM